MSTGWPKFSDVAVALAVHRVNLLDSSETLCEVATNGYWRFTRLPGCSFLGPTGSTRTSGHVTAAEGRRRSDATPVEVRRKTPLKQQT